jgi:hypothetical protein
MALSTPLVGCGEVRPTGPGRTGTGSTVLPKPTNPIVGKWSFTRLIVDDLGYTHMSQTVWDFSSGGAVSRTLYSDNLTTGVGDVVIATGKWATFGSTLEVTLAGSTAPTRYEYYFNGSSLVIANTSFIRLSQ